MSTATPKSPDVLRIHESDGRVLLRITPDLQWEWGPDADPTDAARLFADEVVNWLPEAALRRLGEQRQ